MADEKPTVIVRKQRTPAPFDLELDQRANKAKEQFQAGHPELFPAPVEPAVISGTEPLKLSGPEPEVPPADLPPTGDDILPAPEPEKPASEPAPEPPPPASPPAPEAPEPAPPQDVKPPERDTNYWRELHKERAERRRLQRELDAAKKDTGFSPQPVQPTVPPAVVSPQAVPAESSPPIDDDPLGIKAAVREMEARLRGEQEQREAARQRENEVSEQRRFMESVDRDVAAFKNQHPDYDEAVRYISDRERQNYMLSGAARRTAQRLMSDPNGLREIQRIADDFVLVGNDVVHRDRLTVEQYPIAKEMNDLEAAQQLATGLWLQARIEDIYEDSRTGSRRPVPQIVMDIAQAAGYQSLAAPQTPAATNGTTPKPPADAAARIRQQAKINANSKGVGGVLTGAGNEPQAPVIRSLAEWFAWSKRDPEGARAWSNEMSKRDPHWHNKLQA